MNKGKRWQEEENKLMINEILNKKSLLDISKTLGRSEYSIKAQLEKKLIQNNINIYDLYNNLLVNTVIENKNNLLSIQNNGNDTENEIKLILNNIIDTIEDTHGLNEEQIQCYNLAKNKKNLLITGSGGTGKSTVLKRIVKYFKRNNINIGVTASTGISASLINGTTLHSYLKIGIAKLSANKLYENLKY
jgi:Tfp pilus assembly pilus retraction ATPase PilT